MGYSSRFIEILLAQGAPDKKMFKDKTFMERLFQNLQENGFLVNDIQQNEEFGYYEFMVTDTKNGGQSSSVNWDLLSSPELRLLIEISKDLGTVHKSSFTVEEGGMTKKVDDPQQLLSELMEKAKKGVTIQRYKGLGEMNPGQLWDTTMDPKQRILKQVAIEDAAMADRLFTTLMGSEVPPRKRFIQTHAKNATLDI